MNPPPCSDCSGTGVRYAHVPTLAPTCRTCEGSGVARCACCGREALHGEDEPLCERCAVRFGVMEDGYSADARARMMGTGKYALEHRRGGFAANH